MALRELVPWKGKGFLSRREENPLNALQREMNELLDRFSRGFGLEETGREKGGGMFPTVDVSETDKEIHVTAELPGMSEKDIDVSLSGDNLVIRGEKKAEKEEKGEQFYRRETSFGSFYRTIPLPAEVEADKIEARYKNGVLRITLPKSAEGRRGRKRISVH
jgi:HSP20 family protein